VKEWLDEMGVCWRTISAMMAPARLKSQPTSSSCGHSSLLYFTKEAMMWMHESTDEVIVVFSPFHAHSIGLAAAACALIPFS
jgi:hypothetical protein